MSFLKPRIAKAIRPWLNIPVPGGRVLSIPNLGLIRPRLDLLVIGAGKCGTTSIHEWLNQHPDIFMSSPNKEPDYFFPESKYPGHPYPYDRILRNGMLSGYRRQKYFGESSTIYTSGIFYESNPVPERAWQHNAGMKLVYSLRNPFERLLSHVKQDIYRGRLPQDTQFVPDASLLYNAHQSCYGRQLSHWSAHFPPEQMHVVLLEEFRSDPRPMLDAIMAFLDLPTFGAAAEFPKMNQTSQRGVVPGEVRFRPEQFDHIRDMIERDVHALEARLGRDLRSVWRLEREAWV